MEFLAWLENTGFSTWVRESNSPFAYTLVLYLHSVGMAFLVGISGIVALRILGFAPGLPLAPMAKFFPLMVAGFWINAFTGAVLLMIAAKDFLTNPTFYVKLGAIALAIVCLRRIRNQVFGDAPASRDSRSVPMNDRLLAGTLLALWAVAITAGRLTAYQFYTVIRTVGACVTLAVVFTAVVLLARYIRRLVGSSTEPSWRSGAPRLVDDSRRR